MSMQQREVIGGNWLLAPSFGLALTHKPVTRGGEHTIGAAPQVRLNLLSQMNTWILCFILLVFASTYGFSFQHGSSNTVTGSRNQGVAASDSQELAIVRIQNAGTYLLCSLLVFPILSSIGVEFRRNLLVSSLVFWALLSCVWSNDSSASITSALRMALSVALAFYLLKRYAPNDLLKLLLLVGAIAAAISIVLILVFPKYGLQGRE